jgi:hypothetical protein
VVISPNPDHPSSSLGIGYIWSARRGIDIPKQSNKIKIEGRRMNTRREKENRSSLSRKLAWNQLR